MNLFTFLFQCGIIYVVFSFIWSFFMFLYNAFTQFRSKSMLETYVFKFLNTYLLISLIAMLTLHHMSLPLHSPGLYASVGLLTMYSYLIGRLERNRMVVQINNRVMRMGAATELNMRMETLLVSAGLLYFVACLIKPEIPDNRMTLWFENSIHRLYDTPIIGWIFAFVGFMMLISLLVRSLLYTSMLINRLTNPKKPGNNNDKDDNDFTDYEIME